MFYNEIVKLSEDIKNNKMKKIVQKYGDLRSVSERIQ